MLEVDCMPTPNAICHLLDHSIPSQCRVVSYRRSNRELTTSSKSAFPVFGVAVRGRQWPTRYTTVIS